MDDNRADSARTCIIHFQGKEGEIKKLTEGTVAKIIDVRKQWLSLSAPYNPFTDIAKRSFDFIKDSDERSINDIETCGYHLACYQNFTNINKVERARKTISNSREKRSAEEMDEEAGSKEISTKVARSRSSRRSLGKTQTCRSTNILPETCLICKRSGPLYVTDKVQYYAFFFSLLSKLTKIKFVFIAITYNHN